MVLDIFAASGDVAVLTEDNKSKTTVIAVNSSPAYICCAKAVDWATTTIVKTRPL